jgi:hypothetical protein
VGAEYAGAKTACSELTSHCHLLLSQSAITWHSLRNATTIVFVNVDQESTLINLTLHPPLQAESHSLHAPFPPANKVAFLAMATSQSHRSTELSDSEKAMNDPPSLVPEGEETRKITGFRVGDREG